MAPKRPDGFKKSSSNEEFTKNKLNAQASLHKPNTLGYESDTNVVPSPSQNEKQNTANLKSTTERKKGVFVALVQIETLIFASIKNKDVLNADLWSFAPFAPSARVPRSLILYLCFCSFKSVCSFFSSLFSVCRFVFLFLTFGVKNEWSRSVNRRMRGSRAPAAGNKNSLVRH